jgi:ABC-type branched-subunit amino acid transport system ATPase component
VASDIDFVLDAGARHALIGPNGAGKTTFVNLLTGVLKPSSGRIFLGGEDVTDFPERGRCRRGLARTFQINQLFRSMTVLENVCLATSERTGAARSVFRPLGAHGAVIDESMSILETLRLADEALTPVRHIAYGHQRLVELAIALAQRPRVLLLDEPTAGIPSAEHRLILDVIDSLAEEISVLIIEHDMELVFSFAAHITVLANGRVLASGTPGEIASDPQVRAVYLGERTIG